MLDPAQQPPTLDDVARRAGLSRSTVSSALSNNHCVAASTRERVQLLARKMGYARNPIAAALATRNRPQPFDALPVAIVSHFDPGGGPSLPSTARMEQRLRELGYESRTFNLSVERISPAKLRNLLYHRGYCGVIFHELRAVRSSSELVSLDWSSFCLVCNGRTYIDPVWDFVRDSPYGAVFLAWREARRARHRRIGFLLCQHDPPMLDDQERESSLWNCQRELTAKERAIPPYLGEYGDAARIKKWLNLYRPDVVVGLDEEHYHLLRSLGCQIPEEVAYINLLRPSPQLQLAGVDCGGEAVMVQCAEYFDFLVRHKRAGLPEKPWEMIVSPRWVAGASLPVPKP